MKLNRFLLIVIILLCPFFLTGCYGSEDIDEKAYVIALGVDKRYY